MLHIYFRNKMFYKYISHYRTDGVLNIISKWTNKVLYRKEANKVGGNNLLIMYIYQKKLINYIHIEKNY